MPGMQNITTTMMCGDRLYSVVLHVSVRVCVSVSVCV